MNQSLAMQTSNTNNVVGLQLNSVFASIQSHLRSSSFSESTRRSYETDLRHFFSFTRNGKTLEDLTIEDLKFNNREVENYQKHLTLSCKNVTVNRKMKTIVSLYNKLKRYDFDVNEKSMIVDNLPDDSEKHGFLTFEETEKMADLVLSHKDGNEKYALIKLAVRTSLRKQDLLDLTWEDVYIENQYDENEIVKVQYYLTVVEEKTKQKMRKNFSLEMYESLVRIKSANDNKLFHLTLSKIETMMDSLCKQMDIDARRKVCFHSLRKSGAGYVLEATGDISAAADQLGHKNMNTSRGYYLEDKGNIAGLMMDEKIDKDIFEQLSREEMLKLLNSVENGLGYSLRKKASTIVNKRK